MQDVNCVVLHGRLTKDMEVIYTSVGAAIGKFSVATNTVRKQGEEWVEDVHFVGCTLFGKRVEKLAEYLKKGKEVTVSGSIRQSRWKTDDGKSRSEITINVETINIAFTDKKAETHEESEAY